MAAELYFQAYGVSNGQAVGSELWKVRADGSLALVHDINPTLFGAVQNSFPRGFTAFNHELYFAAETQSQGVELWKVRPNGDVVMVADIRPGSGNFYSSFPSEFTVFNGELFFWATTDGLFGQLWKVRADGSVVPATNVSHRIDASGAGFTPFNGELYFRANTSGQGTELWKVKADGTVVMVADVVAGSTSSTPSGFSILNNELYFQARNALGVIEIWKVKSDGTLVPAPNAFYPEEVTKLGGQYYFISGDELWTSNADGSAVSRASDFLFDWMDKGFTLFDGELYFASNGASVEIIYIEGPGVEPVRSAATLVTNTPIWKVQADGSVVGAARADASGNYEFYDPRNFVAFANDLYFLAYNQISRVEHLWRLNDDGTVQQITGTASAHPADLLVFNGELYFSASGSLSNEQLWKVRADGSLVRAADIYPNAQLSYPKNFTIFDPLAVDPVNNAAPARDDFNGDGNSDILWRHTNGTTVVWQMDGGTKLADANLNAIPVDWTIQATGDFNGDGKSGDILWRHTNGTTVMWLMDGANKLLDVNLSAISTAWQIKGTGDFNGDGKTDIVWRHDNGTTVLWQMDGGNKLSDLNLNAIPTSWRIQGIGDFNGDGNADILWRHTGGTTVMWLMDGGQKLGDLNLNAISTDWHIRGIGDFNADGKSDILWRHDGGTTVVWLMNGGNKLADVNLDAIPTDWTIRDIADFNGDGRSDILWRHDNGTTVMWAMDGAFRLLDVNLNAIPTDWTIFQPQYDVV